MKASLAGIDIGGTKIGICRGSEDGTLVSRATFPTDATADPRDLLEEAVARLECQGPITALGVTCPGPFFRDTLSFERPPNMPRWHGFALGAWLRSRVEAPFVAKNDANALALAEHRFGAGKSVSSLVFFTMSTGMGAGLVLDGRLYEGRRGFAGEVGHLRLADQGPGGFGKRGSLGGFLSGPGLAQLGAEELRIATQLGEVTELASLVSIDAQALCAAASRGDPAAKRAIERAARRLGQLMALLADILEPELFVLGTIGRAWPELFIGPARAVLEAEALALTCAHLAIVPSELVDHGAQSALALALLALET